MGNPLKAAGAVIAIALATAACATNQPAPAAPRASPLANTSWGLTNILGGSGTPMARIDDPSRYRIRFGDDGKLQAQLDCNSGGATWTSTGAEQVAIGPVMSTRMACQPNSLGNMFGDDLGKVEGYTVKEGRLYLTMSAGAGTLIFRPIPWM